MEQKTKLMSYFLLLIAALILGLLAYIRLAPSDVAKWHKAEVTHADVGDYPAMGGFTAVRLATTGDLARLIGFIENTDRTTVLAGSVGEGMITFVTRTKMMGFPDYTTLRVEPASQAGKVLLTIHGRLRFGRSDLGVNRARIEGWLASAGL
jgi:hypothetical protein